jgi:thiol-disulfide isomerase/thioredoxin
MFGQDEETFYFVNFWATWCKPCVEEFPYIEALHEKLDGQKMEIILVSIDFPNDLKDRLIPFVKDQKLKSKVVLLADDDMDTWIREVNDSWDGAIPATIMSYKGTSKFHTGKFSEEGLDEAVNSLLKS